jgi:hypothetical protein
MPVNEKQNRDEESGQARQTIDRFINRFSQSAEGYRALARHAAMPFILTPELLNYIRTEFLSDRVDWVAEADLLLSDLCQEIGHEQYAMKLDVRSELIAEAKRELGGPRMEEIARRLLTWVNHLAQTDPRIRQRDLQAQRWGAMVYLKERREQAVRQMASALAGVEAAETAIGDLFDRAEISRVSAIITDLAHQLEDYRELVEYAALTTRLLNDPTGRLADRLSQEKNLSRRIVVAGVELAHLQKLIPSTPVSPSGAAHTAEPTEADPQRNLQLLRQKYDSVVRQISEEEARLPWVEPENTDWDYRPPAK